MSVPIENLTSMEEVFSKLLLMPDGCFKREFSRWRTDLIFRGLETASYDLTHVLQRTYSGDTEGIERALLRNFEKYASSSLNLYAASQWQVMALGRHYGLPTRYLDWSFSPLVALYFSVANAHEKGGNEEDSAVWRVNIRQLRKHIPNVLDEHLKTWNAEVFSIPLLERHIGTDERHRLAFREALRTHSNRQCPQMHERISLRTGDGVHYPPTHYITLAYLDELAALQTVQGSPFFLCIDPPVIDARISNQFSCLTVGSDATLSMETWLKEQDCPCLATKFVIDRRIRQQVFDNLAMWNITPRMLFPDLGGISTTLRHRYGPNPWDDPRV